jgi:predicted O-methyltransferase YrrM
MNKRIQPIVNKLLSRNPKPASGADSLPQNPAIARLLRENSFEHNGARYPLDFRIATETCNAFRLHIVEHGLKRILEVGTSFGFSTLFFAEAAKETGGHVDTVDIRFEKKTWTGGQEILNVHEVAERLVKEAGLADYVRFLAGHSNDVMPGLLKDGQEYDFILIDGSHIFSVVLLDFVCADQLLADGGYIAMDDVNQNLSAKPENYGGPNRVLESVFATNRYRISLLSRNVVLCRKLQSL